jgi:hypothetical protein
MQDTIPTGATPDEVTNWWNQLTPQQQFDLERACPVQLYDLAGIPKQVQDQLARTDRGYDSVTAVRWALAHVNGTSVDVFDNNCANFVSNALYNAGMPYKLDGADLGIATLDPVRYDSTGWGRGGLWPVSTRR